MADITSDETNPRGEETAQEGIRVVVWYVCLRRQWCSSGEGLSNGSMA